jgi:hypothetical protein
MSHSIYKCAHCGVLAESKCVQQRSTRLEPTGEMDSGDLDSLCAMAALLTIKVSNEPAGNIGGDDKYTVVVSTTQYFDKNDGDDAARERRIVQTLVRRLTWALRKEENIALCELLGQHEWVFLHGENGEDHCMFGCCHAE